MTSVLPFAIGLAFGAALERSGLGDARKLTGQFYFRDFTVFKVMFSAIVTAMLGVFWLSYAGWIDAGAIATPETYLRPQVVGGLVFGAGFALAGLCPGTSCVAAASGRGDGLAVVAGLFAGVLATGAAFPLILDFYDSDARGALTLPALLHLPPGSVILAVVVVALAGFAAVTQFERRRLIDAAASTDRKRPGGQELQEAKRSGAVFGFHKKPLLSSYPPAAPDLLISCDPWRLPRFGWALVILALALGAGAAIVRTPPPRAQAHEAVYKPPSGC